MSASGRIVGGTEATPHSYPWMAALFVDDQWFCGGGRDLIYLFPQMFISQNVFFSFLFLRTVLYYYGRRKVAFYISFLWYVFGLPHTHGGKISKEETNVDVVNLHETVW